MQILANTVVTLTFELFDSDGVLLESTSEPITYLHGGHSGMFELRPSRSTEASS